MLTIDADFEILIVHRDCEGQRVADRLTEIRDATDALGVHWPTVPAIPIRMTEAWLLRDEHAIRAVAGRPTGTESLDLPPVASIEPVADPKTRLQAALSAASGLSGRRLRKFKRDFPGHRRQLLDRLDRTGPVCGLRAWQALELATRRAVTRLDAGQGGAG